MRSFFIILLIICCLSPGASLARTKVIRLAAAASLTDVLKTINKTYLDSHPQVEIQTNFASSGTLARQIHAGAPTDIFVSANPQWMELLKDRALIEPSSPANLVSNRLVCIGRETINLETLADLEQLGSIAIGSPKSTPVGRYTEMALTNAGIYAQLLTQKKLVFAKDVRQALLYADNGEVDAAFVYQTDAQLAQKARVIMILPDALYPQILYPAALMVDSSQNPEVTTYFEFLFSPVARQIFRDYGFVLIK
ncbi:MAG: molybdate ABC transporter substrate-binding protein [Desulfuromonadales bacterium]|nr:molybdate ABC transporter substrate-binding protein [Desulfuromonadales bacterium]MBN2792427.1 molybdate ABC transporter substrate-binding protein [Desulfuromonadales bacterium]